MKTWSTSVNGHDILVENKLSDAILYIDGNVADVTGAIASAKLSGRLPSGEEITAVLGQGITGVQCKLIVDGKIIPTIRKYKL